VKDKYGDQADESESGSESDDDSEVVSAITVSNLASYIVRNTNTAMVFCLWFVSVFGPTFVSLTCIFVISMQTDVCLLRNLTPKLKGTSTEHCLC
jgi:hypothetical protein